MSLAVFAQGTLIKRGDGASPEVFTTIAEVQNIGGPTMRADVVDVTSQDSTDGYREKLAGLIDAGEVSFDIWYVPGNATHALLLTDFTNRVSQNYRIFLPQAVEWEFLAQVAGFELQAPTDGALRATVTLVVKAKPDFDAP